MTNRIQNAAHPLSPLTPLQPVLIRNTNADDAFPPFSLVEINTSNITNTLDEPLIGKDVVLNCIRPTTCALHKFAATGAIKIPAGKTGPGYLGDILPLTATSSAAIGDYVHPKRDAYTVDTGHGPYMVYARHPTKVDVVLCKTVPICHEVQFELLGGADSFGEASAKVTEVLCGCPHVPGINGEGNITVKNTLGCLTLEAGQKGFASYNQAWPITQSNDCQCYWSIKSLCC